VQYSSTGVWTNLTPDPATFITEGDFNGDGKDDLVGIWSGVVWKMDSATGDWTPINTNYVPTQIATGDIDGDGKADLVVNYSESGVWVQFSSTGEWVLISASPATWVTTGIMR
jgi:hypothetical protein